MTRVALTLWFTVTALLGPKVCCCSFAASPRPVTPSAADGQSSPPSKPVKSCCVPDAPPCGEHGKQSPEPGKPSKCPCEHGQQVKTLPQSGPTAAELAAHLEWVGDLFAGLLACSASDSGATTSVTTDTSPPVVRLAGRDLLAAYFLLRC